MIVDLRSRLQAEAHRTWRGGRTVVNLCDGGRTLAEIEDEVFRLHADLFETREEAAVFVAEVVTR